MRFVCAWCGKKGDRHAGHVNRSNRLGAPLYCNMKCSGLGRRLNKTEKQKKLEKSLYDRKRLHGPERQRILEEKRKYYKRVHDPVREAKYRKKHMGYHIQYCQQPWYKEWKKQYDQKYRAEKMFGDFSESFILLMDIEKEIESRMSKYEIYQANGTLNKHQQRRREYEKLISQHA